MKGSEEESKGADGAKGEKCMTGIIQCEREK